MCTIQLYLSQSHKITLYPNCIKGLTEVDQDTAGNTTVLFLKTFLPTKLVPLANLQKIRIYKN